MHGLVAALALAAAPVIKVCTSSVCTKSGAKLFGAAAQGLCSGSESGATVQLVGCLRPCRGIALNARYAPARNGIVVVEGEDLPLETPLAALGKAVETLAELGITDTARDAIAAKLAAEEAADAAQAVALYTEAVDLAPAGLREPVPPKDASPPKWPTRGLAAEREAERISPGRVFWLYEALVGRCRARLELGDDDDAALADAREATRLCPLASGAWYRLRDAASASGDAPLAEEALAELARLGYSTAAGEEGQQATAEGEAPKRYDPWGRVIL